MEAGSVPEQDEVVDDAGAVVAVAHPIIRIIFFVLIRNGCPWPTIWPPQRSSAKGVGGGQIVGRVRY